MGLVSMEDPPCPVLPPPGSTEARPMGCRCRPYYSCFFHQDGQSSGGSGFFFFSFLGFSVGLTGFFSSSCTAQ